MGLDNGNAYNFTDYISEPRPIAAFFQPRRKAQKAQDLSQAPETVELSAGSQDEIVERHALSSRYFC